MLAYLYWVSIIIDFVSRESLCSVLLALELHLDEITKTGEKLTTYHEVTLKLDRQAEILKDAVSTPNHPLITMQDKSVIKNNIARDDRLTIRVYP